MKRAVSLGLHILRHDFSLRASGLLALLGSALAMRTLIELHARDSGHDARTTALSGAVFMAASLGGILLSLGRHVLDEIAVGSRWSAIRPAGPPAFSPYGPGIC